MKLARKVAVATVVGILGLGVAGMTSPASAYDSSWGCGGFCRTAPGGGS